MARLSTALVIRLSFDSSSTHFAHSVLKTRKQVCKAKGWNEWTHSMFTRGWGLIIQCMPLFSYLIPPDQIPQSSYPFIRRGQIRYCTANTPEPSQMRQQSTATEWRGVPSCMVVAYTCFLQEGVQEVLITADRPKS